MENCCIHLKQMFNNTQFSQEWYINMETFQILVTISLMILGRQYSCKENCEWPYWWCQDCPNKNVFEFFLERSPRARLSSPWLFLLWVKFLSMKVFTLESPIIRDCGFTDLKTIQYVPWYIFFAPDSCIVGFIFLTGLWHCILLDTGHWALYTAQTF